MKSLDKISEVLKQPLTSYTRQGKGGNFSYYKGSDVILRLNDAFSHCWSSELIDSSIIEDQVLVLVALYVVIDGVRITHHGYGSSAVARSRADKTIVDIGNTYKSAFTSGLKKAAEQFGIGLAEEEESSSSSSSGGSSSPSYSSQSRGSYSSGSSSSGGSFSSSSSSSSSPAESVSSLPSTASPPLPPRPTLQRTSPLPARTEQSNRPSRSSFSAASLPARGNAGLPQDVQVSPRAPAPSPAPAPSSPAPVADTGSEPLTELQQQALAQIAKLKGFAGQEGSLIKGALPETNKTKFEELLKKEAIVVIRYANNLPLRG